MRGIALGVFVVRGERDWWVWWVGVVFYSSMWEEGCWQCICSCSEFLEGMKFILVRYRTLE